MQEIDKDIGVLAAKMQSTKPPATAAELMAEVHSKQARLEWLQTQIPAKERLLQSLEGSERSTPNSDGMQLLQQRSLVGAGSPAGQPQWKCPAPEGILLAEDQRAEPAKVEKDRGRRDRSSRHEFPAEGIDIVDIDSKEEASVEVTSKNVEARAGLLRGGKGQEAVQVAG